MNFFILDKDPKKSVQMLPDKLVVKMPTETMQMLSVAANILFDINDIPTASGKTYSVKSHINHPCTRWVYESVDNFYYTMLYCKYICEEYMYRYDKVTCAVYQSLKELNDRLIHNICSQVRPSELHITPFAIVTGDITDPNPVIAYRKYMQEYKSHYATWKKRKKPEWWDAETPKHKE